MEDNANPSNWLSLERWQKKKTELHLIDFFFLIEFMQVKLSSDFCASDSDV